MSLPANSEINFTGDSSSWQECPYITLEQRGELTLLNIDHPKFKALFSPYGAQLLAFKPVHEQQPLLWLSDDAFYQRGKAIRGGIPICWPWFADHPEADLNADNHYPAHGYARISEWLITQINADAEQVELQLTLPIPDNQAPASYQQTSLMASLIITLSSSIDLSLITTNQGSETYPLTAAFHSYFHVASLKDVHVHGLEGADYLDKLAGMSLKRQHGVLIPDGALDRIYYPVISGCHIDDRKYHRHIKVQKSGSYSTVIWNPGVEMAKKMSDMSEDSVDGMLCVEVANAKPDVIYLEPGQAHTLSCRISLQ